MRLLRLADNGDFSLVEFLGRDTAPAYAILSHTWGPDHEEVNFTDLQESGHKTAKTKAGYHKLTFCVRQAARDGLKYCWVDTCCINKSDAAELQEAINSMFRWYQNSTRCYAYLSDVSNDTSRENDRAQRWKPAFKQSRWFTRGWTLQELIAPKSVQFFSREETLLGNKSSLGQTIHEITGVALQAIEGRPLEQFGEDERLSWVSKRQTKREEDIVYCLLGFFEVFMPLIYGEGRVNALNRLQEEIRKKPSNGITSLYDEQILVLQASLRFEQMDARHLTIRNAHARTCKWLLNSPEYLDWTDSQNLNKHHGFLWIKGKPGTGKSTLMKYALAHARKRINEREVISFFFNARGDNLEKSTIGTYRSLLSQLLDRFPRLRCIFSSLGLCSSRIKAGYEWNVEALESLLEQALRLLEKPVVCFIDALDECDEQKIRDMVSFFERIGELVSSSAIDFRICFSSRHYPYITIRNGIDLILEGQEGHHQDITNYIEHELRIGKSKLAQQIRSEIQVKSSGIFMWVVLVVGILNKEYDGGRIHTLRRRLQEIPGDLHRLFQEILTRDTQNKQELLLCIQWVLFAKEPMSPTELYWAILSGTEPDALSEWDQEDLTPSAIERFILDSSKGLTDITTSKTRRVQFIHESVRDFLLKEKSLDNIWPQIGNNFQGQSHENLKQCCLNYIELDIFALAYSAWSQSRYIARTQGQDSKKLQEEATLTILQKFPFLNYSINNVLHHTDAAEGYGIAQEYLNTFPLYRWIQYHNIVEKHNVRRYTNQVPLLYLLAERNLGNLIKVYPSILDCLEVGEERYGPPIFASIACGSNRATELFFEALNNIAISNCLSGNVPDQSDVENTDQKTRRSFTYARGRYILVNAIDLGHTRLLASLLDTGYYEADFRDSSQRTLLWWASKNGVMPMVKALVGTGEVMVNSVASKGPRTPIAAAIESAEDEIAELLLRVPKDGINKTILHDQALLCQAVAKNMPKTVRELLDPKSRITVQAGECLDALLMASEVGNSAIVTMLLKASDDANKGNAEYNALQAAIHHGHKQLVRVILKAGADVNEQGGSYGNALQAATHHGSQTFVELLLGAGADVNANTDKYGSALHVAASRGDQAVVKLLLEAGADVNATGGEYGTALQAAALCGVEPIVKALLEAGADVNSLGGKYGSALQAAARHDAWISSGRIVEILLEAGADVNALGGKYGSALQAAALQDASPSSGRIVEVLLKAGAEVNAQGGEYGNALQAAAFRGNDQAVKFLLEAGADANAQGGEYGTALKAVRSSFADVYRVKQFLLAAGAVE